MCKQYYEHFIRLDVLKLELQQGSTRDLYSNKKVSFPFPTRPASTVVDFASLHTHRLCHCLRAGLFLNSSVALKKPQPVNRKIPVNDKRLLPYNSRVGVGAGISQGTQAGREDHESKVSEMIECDHKH